MQGKLDTCGSLGVNIDILQRHCRLCVILPYKPLERLNELCSTMYVDLRRCLLYRHRRVGPSAKTYARTMATWSEFGYADSMREIASTLT